MKFVLLAIFIASIQCSDLFLPENIVPHNFSSCMNNSVINITQAYSMSALTRGQNLTFVLIGTVSGLAQLKQLKVVLYWDYEPYTTWVYPCSEVYQPGDTFKYKFVHYVPSITPSGTYSLFFEFLDVTGKYDDCTEVIYQLY